ncbi:uncharacterized protein EI97DRAFT_211922 [Westerdykella ornata]|uniref:Uncharacterized protein n=1 Tax=Westerdykella ornata TaxID=318751 RepID=A0A6A6J7H3_WESOR|nr:uncharacterized protein EI97DRAFT_211922 [Westerdykella ornata]KAF2272352.1 hypothetical protein EI97DRAFT_211922 [Westerdykella ornata]
MAGPRSLQATVEDCHSTDESDHDSGINESFRRSPAAAASGHASGQTNIGANVAARRSQPSDLNCDKAPAAEKVTNIDLQSDSGYSSHTAATMSSADSGPSAKSQSPPAAPANAAPLPSDSPAGSKRRPTLSRDERHSSESGVRRPLARSGSVSSRNRPRRERQTSESQECEDPNCDRCPGPRRGRPKPSPLESGLDISYPPFDDQRSQRSDPAPSTTSYAPQSPTYTRHPGSYAQGSAIVQPAQTSRPRRASSATRGRPVSFAGDPSQLFWVPGMPVPGQYPPQAHEPHGPPPALSAYHNLPQPQMSGYAMLGASPSGGGFYAPPHMQMHHPQYDMQRPPMHSRTSSNFNARRPALQVYGQPLLTQDTGDMPSARYPSNVPSSATQKRFSRSRFDDYDDDDDESSSEAGYSDEEEENSRALMPPPKAKPSAQRQPSHRQSSSKSERRKSSMSQSLTLEPERDHERHSRKSRVSASAAPSRSASKAPSRPPLLHQPKAQSAFETARNAQIMVEDSRAQRRRSYQGQVYEKRYRGETRYRVESDRRGSRVDFDEDAAADIIIPTQRRRRTDASIRNEVSSSSKLREVANDVEAYQQRTRGSDAPLNDQVHRAAKRGSRIISGASEAGSSRSKGSDKASRVSQSARTTVTNGGGELRLRVDGSARLQFNGDMEGRTLQIMPGEDGMAEIVIADSRGNESAYRSERGSVYDRKTVVSRAERPERLERIERSRREAEEISTRSSRSSQSRRDRDRDVEARPLRRKGEKLYRQ